MSINEVECTELFKQEFFEWNCGRNEGYMIWTALTKRTEPGKKDDYCVTLGWYKHRHGIPCRSGDFMMLSIDDFIYMAEEIRRIYEEQDA